MFSGPEFRSLMQRLFLCVATAAAISSTADICAWLNYRDFFAGCLRPEQASTRYLLEQLRRDVERYQEATGNLPASLADLEHLKQKQVEQPVDGWGRPIHYEVEDGAYRLYSLGRDGAPGGTGQDADLYAGKRDAANESLSLWEFTICPDARGMQFTCFLAGIVAFPLCLLGVWKGPTKRVSPIRVFIVHGLTATFAILTAVVISFLHLPSGH